MEKFDIIIQGGQSNAEGYGLGEVTKAYYPSNKIFDLEVEKNVSIVEGKGVVVDYPDQPFIVKVAEERKSGENVLGDFSLTFARSYVEHGFLAEGRKLLVIRSAIGGTGFQKKHWGLNDPLYQKMLEMTAYALSLNPENRVVGFLWHQGEHDAVEGNTAENYQKQLEDMISDVRENFGNIPFVAGDFVNEWKTQNLEICEPIVNAIKNAVKTSGNAAFVETADLPSNNQKTGNGDPLHFSREALHILGERYFENFSKLYCKE